MTDLAVVEIAFGGQPFDASALAVDADWTDVTTDVREFDYATSAMSDRFSVFVAGNGTIMLDNTTGEYDPDNAAGTYAGLFKRNVPARIIGVHTLGSATFDVTGGLFEDLWTLTGHDLTVGERVRFTAAGSGAAPYAADIDYYVHSVATNLFRLSATLGGSILEGTGGDSSGTWTLARYETQFYGYTKTWTPKDMMPTESVTEVRLTDRLGLLAQHEMVEITEAHFGDNVGTRIGRVLDDYGMPSAYADLDVSSRNLAATEFDTNALTHCQQAAQAEGGVFYAQRDGTLVFDGMAALVSTRQTTPQDVIGHNGPPTPLNDGSLRRAGVGSGYRDLVILRRIGGQPQTVDNSSANAATVAFRKSTMLMESDAQALGVATFYADLYGTESSHPEQIRMVAKTVNEDINTVLFQRRLRDRVTVEIDPAGGADISHDCFIDGMTGRGRNGVWEITYQLSSAAAYDANLGSGPGEWLRLDVDNLDEERLGY